MILPTYLTYVVIPTLNLVYQGDGTVPLSGAEWPLFDNPPPPPPTELSSCVILNRRKLAVPISGDASVVYVGGGVEG